MAALFLVPSKDDAESVELVNSHPTAGSQVGPSSEKSDGKTYREEILIKNSDSGKGKDNYRAFLRKYFLVNNNKACVLVMGVRGRRVHIIEAMSDTIISFEKGYFYFLQVLYTNPFAVIIIK